MIDRTQFPNAFEFVAVASARARQLMRGCTPRVSGEGKVIQVAQREVAAGQVQQIPREDSRPSEDDRGPVPRTP